MPGERGSGALVSAESCSICEETGVGQTWQGVCGPCWLASVESGVHTIEEIPGALRARARFEAWHRDLAAGVKS